MKFQIIPLTRYQRWWSAPCFLLTLQVLYCLYVLTPATTPISISNCDTTSIQGTMIRSLLSLNRARATSPICLDACCPHLSASSTPLLFRTCFKRYMSCPWMGRRVWHILLLKKGREWCQLHSYWLNCSTQIEINTKSITYHQLMMCHMVTSDL